MDELVLMELNKIITSEVSDQQVIYLKEVDGERTFPIVIGLGEALSIDNRVKGDVPPRPLTHDLMRDIIEELGGELQDIVINSLHEHTYYAFIRVLQEDELIEIDARPSDAIALAMHCDPPLPIFVEEDVLDEVA